MTLPPESLQRELRQAARAFGRHGLAHAYGHCSVRLNAAEFLVCAARPMGLLAPGEPGCVVPVCGPLPAGVLGEVRLHQQIYQRQPHTGAIARTMPPALMALSTARHLPRPRHGMGSYFGAGPVLWDDPQLIRDELLASAAADTLGQGNALILRGNGTVVAAANLAQALVFTWYLEDAARLELALLGAGLAATGAILTPDECQQRATLSGGIIERMWDHLTANDPEPAPTT